MSTGIGSFPLRSASFPLRSAAHGREIATATVRKDEDAQNFTIHKSLLSLASKYFDGALNDGFKGSSSGLELSHDCLFAFEVLYQWLYSGKVMDQATWYTDRKIPADLLWLKVYKLADCRLVEPLVETAYARLHAIFAATNKLIAPTADFLYELYDETGPEHLRRYVAFHAALSIHQGLADAAVRLKSDEALNSETRFGAAVASRLMDMRYAHRFQQHPSTMEEFGNCRPRHEVDAGEVLKEE